MTRKTQILPNPQVEAWNKAVTDLRALLPQAVQVLKTGLESDDPKIQQAAALHILKAVGIYGRDLEPSKFDFGF
jgi:hypothetical protein